MQPGHQRDVADVGAVAVPVRVVQGIGQQARVRGLRQRRIEIDHRADLGLARQARQELGRPVRARAVVPGRAELRIDHFLRRRGDHDVGNVALGQELRAAGEAHQPVPHLGPQQGRIAAGCAQVRAVVEEQPAVAPDDDALGTADAGDHPYTVERADQIGPRGKAVGHIGVGGLAEVVDLGQARGPGRRLGQDAVLLQAGNVAEDVRPDPGGGHQRQDGRDQEPPVEL